MGRDGYDIYTKFSPLAYILAVAVGVVGAIISFLAILSTGNDLPFLVSMIGLSVPMGMLALPTALVGFLPAAIIGFIVAKRLTLRQHWQIGALGSICAAATMLPFAVVIGGPAGLFFPSFAIVPGAIAGLAYAKVATWDRTATNSSKKIGTTDE